MGYLDNELARCERRIKYISEHPDPRQLSVNKMLYEIQRDELKKELDAVNTGKPFGYGLGTYEILDALGITPFGIIGAADRSDKQADKYFQVSRGAGFPSTICDRFQMSLGMILSGDAPKPDVVFSVQSCDVETLVHTYAANHWKVPYYFLDFRYNTNISLEHAVVQLRDIIADIEKKVPGAKFNEERLEEIINRRKAAMVYLHEIGQMLKNKPTPISGRDAFRIVGPRLSRQPRGLEFFQEMRDEVRERIANKIFPVPNEKLRILWAVTGPYFLDVFQILAKHDASVPIFLYSNSPEALGLAPLDLYDVSTYLGRKATPLEEATAFLLSTWFGPADRWAREVVAHCKELDIDGVVYYQLSGCPTCRSSAKMVADAVESQVGIPTLFLEGWMLDKEKFDPVLTEEKLEEFLSLCDARKASRN
jgi:benzoyl-CoA reductase/2-hydroxyglutaryl-CoA dehydratase subunit BcrC/BadD/HgdB